MDTSIIVVTSPSRANPCTILIEEVIDSVSLIDGLRNAPVYIVMDGFTLHETVRTKRGRITPEMAEAYEEYHKKLCTVFADNRFTILRCKEHVGFALAVKYGLEHCGTKYALILQHDRKFSRNFSHLTDLQMMMEKETHIRYIGFQSIMSVTHQDIIKYQYGHFKLQAQATLPVNSELELQPLIFWYDSNHLAHVQRYLQIYKPFKHLPQEILDTVPWSQLKYMVLRKGDFIEDKFGQMQRNILAEFSKDSELVFRTFKWFGSYLLWHPDRTQEENVYVTHLRGRQYDPAIAAQRREEGQHVTVARIGIERQLEMCIDGIDMLEF